MKSESEILTRIERITQKMMDQMDKSDRGYSVDIDKGKRLQQELTTLKWVLEQ